MIDEDTPRELPQNRQTSASKLRRSGKHCPVCLAQLSKNVKRTRLVKSCVPCGAHRQLGKACRHCGQESIWQGPSGTACAACGRHGTAREVIAAPGDTASAGRPDCAV